MKSFQKNKNMVWTKRIAIALFLLSAVIMVLSHVATQRILSRIELEYFTEEIKHDTKDNVAVAKNLLDEMVMDLENTAEEIKECEDLWQPEVKEILEFSHSMNFFDDTFIADAQGNAYDASGIEFSVAEQEYFRRAMGGKLVFSGVLPSERFEAIQIIAYPLVSETQEVRGVLFGLFDVETFSQLINAVFDDSQHIYVIDSNGTYVNCFDEQHVISDHKNFWQDMQLRELKNTTLPALKAEFHAGREGEFSYSYEGEQRYGYHMPLGVQDWQIILTVDESVMNSHSHSIRRADEIDLSINTVCLIVMLLCVFVYFRSSNREIRKANEKISKNNEMLQMAVEVSNHIIFEYDIEEKTIILKTRTTTPLFYNQVITHVPEHFIDMNVISEESVGVLQNLFKRIEVEKSSRADIHVVGYGEERLWYRVSMHNLYNEHGDIVATVGSAEDISMLKKGEEAIRRKRETHETLIKNSLLYGRVNLHTGMVVELNGQDAHIPYQEYLRDGIREKVAEEQRPYVTQALSLETLREDYGRGKQCIEVQCSIVGEQGAKWASCYVYQKDNFQVMFVVMDIDEKKRKELALQERAERDGLTKLYNAATTRSKVGEILCSKWPEGSSHIFILMDLDNFKQINDTFGHAYGDQVLIDAANALRERFRSGDVIGRLGGDEFVIMLCNVRSDKGIDDLVSSVSSILKRTYVKGDVSMMVSASMGVAIAPNDGTTFEELYQKADIALYQVKNEGKNGYRRFE